MADEVIGRADYVLGVDNAGVKTGVAESEQMIKASGAATEKAAESSAYRAGVAIGNGIKTGARLAGAAASALFAVATKGVLELTNVQADYTAETGASADEAARAGKAINEMASRNIQPLGEIGKTLAKVHTDLGLTGDEAEKTTQAFLTFARATKQDAAASVVAFDDILDSWGLTAKDAQVIMDKLIVSHQKYGGSIEENQRALAGLAPQLRALNLTIDDGIGLLNLFASSGLDAGAAQVALNNAITKLPKGESLQAFLTRLSQVQDSGQRAQMAIDVFGQKAGAKLANAMQPGIAGIDTFKVSTEDATGATQKAADALNSTFGARTQLLINNFGSKLRGIGSDWGPLLTGAASAGTLLSTVFGDDLIRKLGPNVVKAFKALGGKAGGALSDGVGQVFTGAGGTVAGNFIASRIETMVDSTKNSRIAEAIRVGAAKSGALFGVIFASAQGVGGTLVNGLAGVVSRSALAGPARAAVLAAGIELGTLQGTAFATAAGAAIVAAPAIVIAVGIKFVQDVTPDLTGGVKDQFKQRLDDIASGKVVMVDAGANAGQAYVDSAAAAIATKLGPAINDGLDRTRVDTKPLALKINHAFGSDLAAHSSTATAWAHRQGNLLAGKVAQGIDDARQTVEDAWTALIEGLKHPMSRAKEISQDLGRLAGKHLIEGLHSTDPAVKAQAQFTRQLIIDRLNTLVAEGGHIGKKGMEELRKAMHSKNPQIRDAAKAIYNAAVGPKSHIAEIPPKAKTWGEKTAQAYADGLEASVGYVQGAVQNIASILANGLKATSPPVITSPLHHIGRWGERTIEEYARGLRAGGASVDSAVADITGRAARGLGVSSTGASFLMEVAAAAPVATVRLEHTITADSARALAASGFDEKRVADILREGADASGLVSNLQSLRAMSGS